MGTLSVRASRFTYVLCRYAPLQRKRRYNDATDETVCRRHLRHLIAQIICAGPQQVGLRRKIVPVKEMHSLKVQFPLKSYVDRVHEKPFAYLSNLFGGYFSIHRAYLRGRFRYACRCMYVFRVR